MAVLLERAVTWTAGDSRLDQFFLATLAGILSPEPSNLRARA